MGAASSGLPGHACCRFGGHDPQSGAALGACYDHNQSTNHQGVLVVCQQSVENYNAETGDRRCDFHGFTKAGSVLALGAYSGEIFIIDAATFAYVKAITGRESPLHGPEVEVELATVGGSSSTTTGAQHRITCIHIADEDTVISGDAAGYAKSYRLSRGDVLMTYMRDDNSSAFPRQREQGDEQQEGEEEELGGGGEGGSDRSRTRRTRRSGSSSSSSMREGRAVTAIAGCSLQVEVQKKPLQCVLIGYRDGLVHAFDMGSGKCLRSLSAAPGLRSIHIFSGLHTAVLAFDNMNKIWLWDLRRDETQVVDFEGELQALRHSGSMTTCVYADSSHNLLLAGTDDAKIYVRRVVRPPGEGSCYSIQLLRVGCPAATTASAILTSHNSQQQQYYPISSLWYDSVADTVFVGDVSGTLRVIRDASGMAQTKA